MASTFVTLFYICAVFGVNSSVSGKRNRHNGKHLTPVIVNDIITWPLDPIINMFNKVKPEHVTFYLYTRPDKKTGTLMTKDTIKNVKMDKTLKTKIISHGWGGSHEAPSVQYLKNTYLDHRDCNVVMVNWSPIAINNNYQVPARLVHQVGQLVGDMINALIKTGLKPSLIHLVGFSLGGHVVAEAGNHSVEKLPRATILDAAAPTVSNHTKFATAAGFVDVIHTCAPLIGIYEPIGTIDFYPNGGRVPQPDCPIKDIIAQECSHNFAWVLFAETIKNSTRFSGRECKDKYRPLIGEKLCQGKSVYMGDGVPKSATGIYYVKAKGVSIPNLIDTPIRDVNLSTIIDDKFLN